MANICWFEIRMKGTQDACYAFFNSDLPCYDIYVDAEDGNKNDCFMTLKGECPWDLKSNMILGDASLQNLSKKLQLEIEAFAIDESGIIQEHYHYDNGNVLVNDYLLRIIEQGDVEDGEYVFEESEANKYKLIESEFVFALKEEFCLNIEFDDDGIPIFPFK